MADDPILAVLRSVAAGHKPHHGYDAGLGAGEKMALHRCFVARSDAARTCVSRGYLDAQHTLTDIGRDVLTGCPEEVA